jgi:hypothetical protein
VVMKIRDNPHSVLRGRVQINAETEYSDDAQPVACLAVTRNEELLVRCRKNRLVSRSRSVVKSEAEAVGSWQIR